MCHVNTPRVCVRERRTNLSIFISFSHSKQFFSSSTLILLATRWLLRRVFLSCLEIFYIFVNVKKVQLFFVVKLKEKKEFWNIFAFRLSASTVKQFSVTYPDSLFLFIIYCHICAWILNEIKLNCEEKKKLNKKK